MDQKLVALRYYKSISLAALRDSDSNSPGVKFNFSLVLFRVLLPLGIGSAFAQGNLQLACDSVSVSKAKCGFLDFVHAFVDPYDPSPRGYYIIQSCFYHGNCGDCEGTTIWTYDINSCTYSPDATIPGCGFYAGPATDDCGFNTSPCIPPALQGDIVGLTATYFLKQGTAHPCPDPNEPIHTATATLSDEYTTPMLASNTVAALPAYPGTFTGNCSAYRNLSSDESSYSIQRFRYKFTFPAAEQPFIIHWVERFTPDGGGSPADTSRSESIPAGATESNVREVVEPNSNGTVTIECVGTLEVETASIRDGQFVITVPALDCSAAAGTLDLILKQQGSSNQIVLKTFQNQPPGTITVRLDDVMNVDGGSPLDGQDGIVFDRAAARWRIGAVDETGPDRNLDVPVEVLSQRTISNYFSPTWGGSWGGQNKTKGVYPAGQFPTGLYNVHVRTQFLDGIDRKNEGLAMDGNTVIRTRLRDAVRGFPLVTSIDGVNNIPNDTDTVFGNHGYICFPDVDQRNTASGSTVQFLRSTSVAVRSNADRLSYRTADEVYVPGFGIRTVDDAGELYGNTHQIDVWRGQGDATLKAVVDGYSLKTRTCLKILPQ